MYMYCLHVELCIISVSCKDTSILILSLSLSFPPPPPHPTFSASSLSGLSLSLSSCYMYNQMLQVTRLTSVLVSLRETMVWADTLAFPTRMSPWHRHLTTPILWKLQKDFALSAPTTGWDVRTLYIDGFSYPGFSSTVNFDSQWRVLLWCVCWGEGGKEWVGVDTGMVDSVYAYIHVHIYMYIVDMYTYMYIVDMYTYMYVIILTHNMYV